MTSPRTLTSRRQRIVELLEREQVHSQAQLRRMLADSGFEVTQATLSRDLDQLRAVKVLGPQGRPVYALPGEGGDPTPHPADSGAAWARLRRLAEDLVASVDHSGNIVVVRTPPGAAPYLASGIDHAGLTDVIGTVAGDDTVLLVTREPAGGPAVAQRLLNLTGGRAGPPGTRYGPEGDCRTADDTSDPTPTAQSDADPGSTR